MYPRKRDLAYFNNPAIWFAGVIIEVLGGLCPHGVKDCYCTIPVGPQFHVLLMANGFVYEAIVMEHDNSLGGWIVLSINGESTQLQQALEWTFYQGPPHLARTVQDIEARLQEHRAIRVGLAPRAKGSRAMAIVEGDDIPSVVSDDVTSDYNDT